MASLAQYLDVAGYVLHITSALATTYTEGSTTFTLGSQDDSAVPGTVSASGIASHYAIVDVGGTALIEAGALASRQPVKIGFPFTIEAFETAPKIIAQGALENAGAVGRVRKRRKREDTVEGLKVLSDTVAAALEPAPEPVVEVEEPEPTPEPVTVDDDAAVIAARAKVAEVIAETQAKAEAEATAMRAAFEAAQRKKAEADAIQRDREIASRLAEQARRRDADAQEARQRAEAIRLEREEQERLRQAAIAAEQDEKDALAVLKALYPVWDKEDEDEQEKPKNSMKIQLIRGRDGKITGGTIANV